MPVAFSSEDGILKAGGHRLYLKGVNWSGFETPDWNIHGLWAVKMSSILDFLVAHKFNALRIPFSTELALQLDDKKGTNTNYAENPDLKDKSAGQVMDILIAAAAARGILILLDMHRLTASKGVELTPLWHNEDFDEAATIRAWEIMAMRYKDSWNVFGADLHNEPHGQATWGDGDKLTDWREGAQRIGNAVLKVNPRLLIFVEGTGGNNVPIQTPEACNWGGALCSAAVAPLCLDVPSRLVYSPHVYGPGVAMQEYFKGDSFPGNMPDIWTRQWTHLHLSGTSGPAVVPGEWGGHLEEGSEERVWAEAFVDFQLASGITDSFFWVLNPNSGDTGGLLKEDWIQPQQYKLDLLARANPNPTRFTADGDVANRGGGDAYNAGGCLPQPPGPPPPVIPTPKTDSTPGTTAGGVTPVVTNGGVPIPAPTPGTTAPTKPDGPVETPGGPDSAVGLTRVVKSEHYPLEVSTTVTKAWVSGSTTLYQIDIAVKGTYHIALTNAYISWPASAEDQVWNLTLDHVNEFEGRNEYRMPVWVMTGEGLKPGEPFTCGGIFNTPDLDLRIEYADLPPEFRVDLPYPVYLDVDFPA